MTNAEQFERIFGFYATELWSLPEDQFLRWLNTETHKLDDYIQKSVEDIKSEINNICENSIYPPTDTFFRTVVDEDYFFGLEYATMIIDKHISRKDG